MILCRLDLFGGSTQLKIIIWTSRGKGEHLVFQIGILTL
jgi:hypothetical protein